MLKTLQVGLMLIAICVAVELRADVLSFDDLTDNGTGQPILDGYHGFQWENFYVMNVKDFSALPYVGPNNGYANGLVSGDNVAFNGYGVNGDGAPALVHNGLFDFNSAYFNAAWNDGLSITVVGKLAGKTVAESTFTVNAAGPPTLETFDWTGIDELDFTAGGGTHHAGYNGMGTHFTMDDFNVTPLDPQVPEPSRLVGLASLSAAGLSLGLICCLRRRRPSAIASR